MSEVAIDRDGADAPTVFRPLAIVLMLAIGVIGFAATLVLGAYAPSLDAGLDGGGHALSNSAVGYSGLVQLMAATGRHPHIVRDQREWGGENLLVATPPSGAINLARLLAMRGGRMTLLVMPKWLPERGAERPGWVRIRSPLATFDPASILAPGLRLTVTRHADAATLTPGPDLPASLHIAAPARLQVFTETDAQPGVQRVAPLVTDGRGGIVLGQLDGRNVYLLSDPDLLDNAGMKDEARAAAALALIDWLSPNGAPAVDFDVTLAGVGSGRNPLRLAFDPPFLATTLTIAAVLALLGVQAFGRFGAARPPQRAIAFGKAALVDNSAAMVAKAGRAHRLGGRYAEVVRERAAGAFGISPRVKGEALDATLDSMGGRERFTTLAGALNRADTDQELLAAARALDMWQRERRA